MVNQLLTEMDGFRKEELVFIVATTNFAESLDPALLRPGRFELIIEIPYPDKEDRKAILEIYRKKFALDVDDEVIEYMVQRTGGFVDHERGIRFSGDHIYALMRGLKREQLRQGGELKVTKEEVDKALGGRKDKKKKLTPEEERTVALHEAGHAILAYTLPDCPTVERITISSEEEDYLGYVMHAVAKHQHVRTQRAGGQHLRGARRPHGRAAVPERRVQRLLERSAAGDRHRVDDGRGAGHEPPRRARAQARRRRSGRAARHEAAQHQRRHRRARR